MGSNIVLNTIRFILLLILQVLVVKNLNIDLGAGIFFHVFVYPLFIFLFPLTISRWGLILLGFLMGFSVDLFYHSYGVHASALTFTAFMRYYVLQWTEPREKYSVNFIPNTDKLGVNWFFQYASILLIFHLLFFYSVEYFTLVYFFEIITRSFFSYVISIAFIMMIMVIFKPKS